MRLSHTRESGHSAKCGRIVCLQEEYPSINIGQDWTTFDVGVSKKLLHEEIIDHYRCELVNVYMKGRLIQVCGP